MSTNLPTLKDLPCVEVWKCFVCHRSEWFIQPKEKHFSGGKLCRGIWQRELWVSSGKVMELILAHAAAYDAAKSIGTATVHADELQYVRSVAARDVVLKIAGLTEIKELEEDNG